MKAFLFNGKSMDFSMPRVMGTILSPDSFYAGSRCIDPEKVPGLAETMIRAGAYILDLGAVSTRPGAPVVIEEEEWDLLLPALGLLRDAFPETIISVDTLRGAARQPVSKTPRIGCLPNH